MNQIIVISGPTASGKTDLAIKMAQDLDCDIVNADSRQVYREMNIGTAKPSSEQLSAVKHHFIDHISIHDDHNVGIYEKEVITFLTQYFEHNPNIILVGGTGLYIDAVIHGIDEFPDIDTNIRDQVHELYKSGGLEALQLAVQKVDPAYFAEVDTMNPRRLTRALEVFKMTGETFSSYRRRTKKERNFEVKYHVLDIPRPSLYERINRRVDQMILTGLEAEAEGLYPYKDLKALQTVGYREWFDHFDGLYDRQTAIDLIKQNTRRYAKRQVTWMKKYKTSTI